MNSTPIKKATTSSIKEKLQTLGSLIPTDCDNNPLYKCDICDCIFNSKESSDQHFNGKKHSIQANKNGGAKINAVLQNTATKIIATNDSTPNKIYDLHCGVCDKKFNSQNSAEQHFTGKNHSLMVAGDESLVKTPSSLVGKHHCSTCNVTLTSEQQLTQHLSGTKHKMAVGIIPDKWQGMRANDLRQYN